MLESLEEHKKDYEFITIIIKRIIEHNKAYADIYESKSIPYTQITGFILGEEYTDIVRICNEKLDLFNKFKLKVTISKTLIDNDIEFITRIT